MTFPPKPAYCISVREADAPTAIVACTWMRRKTCCDCGEPVIYNPQPLLYELVNRFLIICHQCAHERTIDAGNRDWTRHVEARPKGTLD